MHFCQDEATALAAGLPVVGYCVLCARRAIRAALGMFKRGGQR